MVKQSFIFLFFHENFLFFENFQKQKTKIKILMFKKPLQET